jgi:hypothetical protein
MHACDQVQSTKVDCELEKLFTNKYARARVHQQLCLETSLVGGYVFSVESPNSRHWLPSISQ